MTISSLAASTYSYSSLKTGSLSIKGQSSDTTDTSKTQSSSKTDSVTLSSGSSASSTSSSTETYTIGGDTVSKAVFDEYDTNGDGKISSDELAAYEAAKGTSSSSDSSGTSSASESSETKDSAASAMASAAQTMLKSAGTTSSALLSGLGSTVNTYA